MADLQKSRATPFDQVTDVLPALATFGLPGGATLPGHVEPEAAPALVSAALGARLAGPLLDALRSGDIELPDEDGQRLRDAHRASLVRSMQLEQRLLEVVDLLASRSVPCVVLKGAAVAHMDRPAPADRAWSDVDVLVPGTHIERAVELVVGSGAARVHAEPRPGWDRRFGKSVELRGADSIEIDLHRTLVDGVHGHRIPLDHLFATTETFELAGRRLEALSAPARVLHAGYHAVVGSLTPSWTNLRDLAFYFGGPAVPVADVVAEARRWRGEAVLVAAVELVRAELPIELPEWFAWADAVHIERHEQALASRLRQGDHGLSRLRLDLLNELPTASDKTAYLAALAFPLGAGRSNIERYRRWLPALFARR